MRSTYLILAVLAVVCAIASTLVLVCGASRKAKPDQQVFEYVFPVGNGRTAADVLASRIDAGWRVVSITPFGDANGQLVSLVVLEREPRP